jgi:hypothetical protein
VVRSRRRLALPAVLGMVLLVGSTACGARLSPHQRALAIQQGGGGSQFNNNSSQAPTATGPTTAATTGPQSTNTGGTQGTAGTKGTTTTTGGSGAGPKGQSCTATSSNNGGKTDVGITATTINLGNISDISGPVPGLFKSAREASQAYVNYFNASFPQGICGRKLILDTYDSRTDSTSYRTAAQQGCSKDFALAGGQSAFDDGGQQPISQCKIPSMPAAAVTSGAQATPQVHAAVSTDVHHIANVVPEYFKAEKSHAAFLYIDAGASSQNGANDVKAYEKYWGTKFVYTAAIPIQNATTQGFKPYVDKMKQKGATFVQWIGAYQEAASLAQAMDSDSFHPNAFVVDPTAYNSQFLQQAGSHAEAVHTFGYSPATEIHGSQPEEQLYEQWLTRSGISSEPTFFGQCAWSAMELFVQTAFKIGPHLTRAAMNAALNQVKDWTGNGITSKQNVGGKISGTDSLILKVTGGRWGKVSPGDYIHGALIAV